MNTSARLFILINKKKLVKYRQRQDTYENFCNNRMIENLSVELDISQMSMEKSIMFDSAGAPLLTV